MDASQGSVAGGVGDAPNQDMNPGSIFSSYFFGSSSGDVDAYLLDGAEYFADLLDSDESLDISHIELQQEAEAPASAVSENEWQVPVHDLSCPSLTRIVSRDRCGELVEQMQYCSLEAQRLGQGGAAGDYCNVASSDLASRVQFSSLPHHVQPFLHCGSSRYFMSGQGSPSYEDSDHHIKDPLYTVESKHSQSLPFDLFYDTPKLAPASHGSHDFQNSLKLGFPQSSQASTSLAPITPLMVDDDSEALQRSTVCGSPSLVSSRSTVNRQTSVRHHRRHHGIKRRSFSVVPISPTPSHAGKRKKFSRTSRLDRASAIAFKVKTKSFNLDDGFVWRKYGKKSINGQTYSRSYYRCSEHERCGCKMLKHIQRCSDDEEDHVQFTYLGGKHNHQ